METNFEVVAAIYVRSDGLGKVGSSGGGKHYLDLGYILKIAWGTWLMDSLYGEY